MMGTSVITQTILEKLRQIFKSERLPVESMSFEIQEDGNFLLISMPAAAISYVSVAQRMALLVGNIVPERRHADSWMLILTQGDTVVDSYSGGKLAG